MSQPEPAAPTAQARPPGFAECYVCQKQFGSRSIALHESRCLERWRAANAALPADQRASTPVKPDTKAGRAPPAPAPSLNSSWPRSNGRMREQIEAESSPRVSRPRTATLKEPRLLDAEKSNELDMSTARCSELLEIVSLNSQRRRARAASEERAGDRPRTIRLTQASKDLNVPNIDYRAPATVLSPDRGPVKASKTGRRLPNFTRALEELFNVPRNKAARVPKPCMSCGKPENPERFHSHPADPPAEPARRHKRSPKKRLSTQRPVAIKYRPPPSMPTPPVVDLVAQRKQQLEEEQRQKQARLKEEYLKKEEKSKKAREDAMRKKLAFNAARQERPPNANAAKPVICYICGKQFGANSLPIHQPQCLERWRRENEALPKEKRQAEPRPPSNLPEGSSVQENNLAAPTEVQGGLVPCGHCGRTFFPERVALHEKNCRPKDGDPVRKEVPAQNQPTICYICKARFPPEEIAAHEVDCVKRWRAENAVITQQIVLPENAPPAAPVSDAASQPSGEGQNPEPGPAEKLEGQLDAMIDAAWQSHLSELVPCPNCGRTFFPDRLEKHRNHCRVEVKAK